MRLVLLLCRGKVFWDFFLRILHLKSGHHRWELCLSLSMHFIKRQMLQAALLMSICRPRRASLSPGSDTLELCKDICASWISVTPCYPWNNAAAVGTFSTLDEIWWDASLFFGLQPLLRRAFPFLSADMFWLCLSQPPPPSASHPTLTDTSSILPTVGVLKLHSQLILLNLINPHVCFKELLLLSIKMSTEMLFSGQLQQFHWTISKSFLPVQLCESKIYCYCSNEHKHAHGRAHASLARLLGAAEREGAASIVVFSTRGNCDSLFSLSWLLVCWACAAGLALLSLSNAQTGRGAGAW